MYDIAVDRPAGIPQPPRVVKVASKALHDVAKAAEKSLQPRVTVTAQKAGHLDWIGKWGA
jgi:hypothetical protein